MVKRYEHSMSISPIPHIAVIVNMVHMTTYSNEEDALIPHLQPKNIDA